MAKDHPDQVTLQTYLAALTAALGPLAASADLALHLEVTVAPPHLLQHHDLENYLTPLVQRLGAARFVFVSGVKRTTGPSCLHIGRARPAAEALSGWSGCACALNASTQSTAFKEQVRVAVAEQVSQPLPPGPVAVQLAWRCAPPPHRKRVGLWKPTGDALGPVLGVPNPRRPFSPNDDRIVALQLHRLDDASLVHGVECRLWWRPALA